MHTRVISDKTRYHADQTPTDACRVYVVFKPSEEEHAVELRMPMGELRALARYVVEEERKQDKEEIERLRSELGRIKNPDRMGG